MTLAHRILWPVVVAALAFTLVPREAGAIRVVTWNLWEYPGSALAARQPSFRAVMPLLNPDVLITQEMTSQAGADSFLLNVLNVHEPGEWTGTWRSVGAGSGTGYFWKPAVVHIDGVAAIANTQGPRSFGVGRVTPVGYAAASAKFLLYSVHLKAGSSATDSTTRRLESGFLRTNYLNVTPALAAGGNFIVGGDFNMHAAGEVGSFKEGGYTRLVESTDNDNGRCWDPISISFYWSPLWRDNSNFAYGHTQSPCTSCPHSGMANGGLDDRFDFFLTSYSFNDGEGLAYVPALHPGQLSYPFIFGNDGAHFNQAVNAGGFNNSVGIDIANHLHNASDHLPVVITIQVPAKIVADSQLDIGDAIVGGAPSATLSVANGAAVPGDELDYSFTAPSGFTAPPGAFQVNAGAAPALHAIGMETLTSGLKSGTLAIASDDPDSAVKNVLLSGRVLEHSVPSLDSLSTVVMMDLDFGERESGAFPDSAVRVHNHQLIALQARLSVDDAQIAGGDGRFSIVGGFEAALLGATGKSYAVRFDDDGATQDSTYTATLTFSVSDEPLPGATPGPNLVVNLSATPASGTVDVRPGAPAALRFYPPRPNPLSSGATFAFDLPQAASVDLAIYDLSGRRIATLASGQRNAGRHAAFWDARDAHGGRVAAGIYFASFETEGMTKTARVVVLP
jgi:endonuclease/exonuclease/phosphatase family metal-dependent hydrolase